MKKQNHPFQMKACNIRFVVWVLVLTASLWGIIFLLNQKKLLFLPVLFAVLSVLGVFLDPAYYVFNKKEIIFVYFFGYRKILSWRNVKAVNKWRSYPWNPLGSNYTIHYTEMFRGRIIRQSTQLLATRKIKVCFKRYYVGFISGEDEPRKKKVK